MRIHCLGGKGAIGSLFASKLSEVPRTKIRLILRNKKASYNFVKDYESDSPSVSASTEPLLCSTSADLPYDGKHISLSVHNKRTIKHHGIEVEIAPNDRDLRYLARLKYQDTVPQSMGLNPCLSDYVMNDPIKTLLVTTKTNQTNDALRTVVHRLSSDSTVILCQNGMGVLEEIINEYWPDVSSASSSRPSFIVSTTTHGAYRSNEQTVHSGMGNIQFGLLPNPEVLNLLHGLEPPWDPNSTVPLASHVHQLPSNFGSLLSSPTFPFRHLVDHPHLGLRTLSETVSLLLHPHMIETLATSYVLYPNLLIAQLSKLAVNASINTLTAIQGVKNGDLLKNKYSIDMIRKVAFECSAIFRIHWAIYYSPAPVPNDISKIPPFSDSHPLSAQSLFDRTIAVASATRNNYSSTFQDLVKMNGKVWQDQVDNFIQEYIQATPSSDIPSAPTLTEMQYMNGYLESLGQQYSVPTPTISTLKEMVLMREQMIRNGSTVVSIQEPVPDRVGVEIELVESPVRDLQNEPSLSRQRFRSISLPVSLPLDHLIDRLRAAKFRNIREQPPQPKRDV